MVVLAQLTTMVSFEGCDYLEKKGCLLKIRVTVYDCFRSEFFQTFFPTRSKVLIAITRIFSSSSYLQFLSEVSLFLLLAR